MLAEEPSAPDKHLPFEREFAHAAAIPLAAAQTVAALGGFRSMSVDKPQNRGGQRSGHRDADQDQRRLLAQPGGARGEAEGADGGRQKKRESGAGDRP